jgi:hypothetical protein
MSDFKWMKRFAKLLLYCVIGGGLAFIICSVALYCNAMSVAKDISRNYLMQVCADGCSNAEARSNYYEGLILAYESKYLVIPNALDEKSSLQELKADDTSSQLWGTEVDESGKTINHNEAYVPNKSVLDYASRQCLKVVNASTGDDLENATGCDYVKYVQRGTPITVTATVKLRYFLPFKFGVSTSDDDEYYVNFVKGELKIPISASTTGISTRYFRTAKSS